MNTVDLIRDFLIECHVEYLFGVPGYANHPMYLSTLSRSGVDVVLTKHEASAAWMAYGYALSTGRFGACTGTSGAGTTNLVSGVVAAYYNSIPVLVLTGQVEREKFGRGAFQELTGSGCRSVSALKIFEPITKLNVMIEGPNDLPAVLEKAHVAMTTGRRGPVHINIPIDVQKAVVEDASRFLLPRPAPVDGSQAVTDEQLGSFKAALAKARAPMVLLGRGCRGDRDLARRFVEELGVPFCTTIQAKGLLSFGHHYDFGVAGIAGSPRCNQYLAETCDLLIAIGTSLNEFTTSGYASEFGAQGNLIHVNLDPTEFNKNYPTKLPIATDCRAFFERVLDACPLTISSAIPELREAYGAVPVKKPVERSYDDGRIAPMDVMAILEEECPSDTVFLADSGNNAVWTVHYLETTRDQDFQIDINTGCMASGVISAIGSKLARPDRPLVSICGDGGFMMSGFELTTAADFDVPVLWVVMNDHKLGMVKQGGMMKFGVSVGDEFKHCDIAAVAASLGVGSRVVSTAEEFRSALKDYFVAPSPFVLDVRFNDSYLPAVYARVKKAADDRNFRPGRGV